MFTYGRTDAINATTVDSHEFVQAMGDSTKQVQVQQLQFNSNVQFKTISRLNCEHYPQNTERVTLLQRAVQTHKESTYNVSTGLH